MQTNMSIVKKLLCIWILPICSEIPTEILRSACERDIRYIAKSHLTPKKRFCKLRHNWFLKKILINFTCGKGTF